MSGYCSPAARSAAMWGQHCSHTVAIALSGNSGRWTPRSEPHTTQLQPPLIARSISRSALSDDAGTGSAAAGSTMASARTSSAQRANAAVKDISGNNLATRRPAAASAATGSLARRPNFTSSARSSSARCSELVTAATSAYQRSVVSSAAARDAAAASASQACCSGRNRGPAPTTLCRSRHSANRHGRSTSAGIGAASTSRICSGRQPRSKRCRISRPSIHRKCFGSRANGAGKPRSTSRRSSEETSTATGREPFNVGSGRGVGG
uniref:Uncharacterized protein n=2 Tax=unclassified Mycobacterium TaxID=2642494 RepID=A0A5Q5BSV7_MYCSS